MTLSAHTQEAIIVGLATFQGLQTARIMARRNIPVIALTDDLSHYCCQTRVCREIHHVSTKTDELISFLEAMGPRFSEKPVLIPCHDESVFLLSKNRQRLAGWYHFNLPSHDSLDLLMNKSRFYRFAQEQGYPVPATYYVHDDSDLQSVARSINYPCIIKPPKRAKPWTDISAYKAYKADNEEQLINLYKACKGWADTLLIQEWVEGADADLYSCNCYFSETSVPLATFISRKLRQHPPLTGESCLGEECRNDEALQLTLKLFAQIGLRGLGYLEVKRDNRTGRHYIIEPNIGRPTGRSAIAEAGGVEMLYTMYCDLLGLPLPLEREQKYTGIKWIRLTRDIASAYHYWRKGELNLRSWWKSISGKKVYAIFSMSDPMPFLAEIAQTLRFVVLKRERHRCNAYEILRAGKVM